MTRQKYEHPYTIIVGVYQTTPLGRLSMFDISIVGMAVVPKRPTLETSRQELSESFVICCLLVVEQSTFDHRPREV